MTQVPGNGGPRPRYITPEGERALRDELQYLWKVKRPKVTQAVREAAALGDRSENAEYIYGKKQLREIDRRVRFLSKRLEELTVVDHLPDDRDKVFFGAWVTVEDEEGDEKEEEVDEEKEEQYYKLRQKTKKNNQEKNEY